MKIIVPRAFDPAKITTTNLPLSETVWAAGTVAVGARRYVLPSYDLYEAVAATADNPVTGAAKEVATWVKVGKVNRFAAFDTILGNPSTGTGIAISLAPDGSVTNGLALFGVTGTTATVTVADPTDGTIYSRVLSLSDESGVFDWGSYFFSPVIRQTDYALTDLPLYGSATVTLTLTGAGTVGEMVLGQVAEIGDTGFGSEVNILDFSRKDRDVFGNAILIRRAYADRVTYDGTIQTSRVAFARRLLASVRAVPTVYIGSVAHPETVVFGFFRDFTITLSGPSVSDCTLEVEGLI
jgi:hypothetical protein